MFISEVTNFVTQMDCAKIYNNDTWERPMYTLSYLQYTIPTFMMPFSRKSIFLHYKNNSTLTFIDD